MRKPTFTRKKGNTHNSRAQDRKCKSLPLREKRVTYTTRELKIENAKAYCKVVKDKLDNKILRNALVSVNLLYFSGLLLRPPPHHTSANEAP